MSTSGMLLLLGTALGAPPPTPLGSSLLPRPNPDEHEVDLSPGNTIGVGGIAVKGDAMRVYLDHTMRVSVPCWRPDGLRARGTTRVTADPALHLALSRDRPAFEQCYDERLGWEPSLSGSVEVVVTVGRSVDARVTRSTLPDDAVATCVLQRLATLRLPEGAPADLAATFTFTP